MSKKTPATVIRNAYQLSRQPTPNEIDEEIANINRRLASPKGLDDRLQCLKNALERCGIEFVDGPSYSSESCVVVRTQLAVKV